MNSGAVAVQDKKSCKAWNGDEKFWQRVIMFVTHLDAFDSLGKCRVALYGVPVACLFGTFCRQPLGAMTARKA